jgi:predicted  nucleic acid-binding Zn-ribbon protein
VHPDLEALLVLQDADVALANCDARLKALEPELRALNEQIVAAERVVAQARAGIQAALDRRDGLEGKIASYRTMQEQRRQKLEWVRGAKEASTLMAELDLARSVLAKEEAEFMRSGDAVGEAERKTAEAENALQNVRDAQAAQREALAGRRQAIAAERETMVLQRDAAAKGVNAGLLAKYDRIRRGKAPLAVYRLHGSSCGNCFTAVPTQRKALIQRGATIEGCEACGVLLYAKE